MLEWAPDFRYRLPASLKSVGPSIAELLPAEASYRSDCISDESIKQLYQRMLEHSQQYFEQLRRQWLTKKAMQSVDEALAAFSR